MWVRRIQRTGEWKGKGGQGRGRVVGWSWTSHFGQSIVVVFISTYSVVSLCFLFCFCFFLFSVLFPLLVSFLSVLCVWRSYLRATMFSSQSGHTTAATTKKHNVEHNVEHNDD
jgi:hypothetical protein